MSVIKVKKSGVLCNKWLKSDYKEFVDWINGYDKLHMSIKWCLLPNKFNSTVQLFLYSDNECMRLYLNSEEIPVEVKSLLETKQYYAIKPQVYLKSLLLGLSLDVISYSVSDSPNGEYCTNYIDYQKDLIENQSILLSENLNIVKYYLLKCSEEFLRVSKLFEEKYEFKPSERVRTYVLNNYDNIDSDYLFKILPHSAKYVPIESNELFKNIDKLADDIFLYHNLYEVHQCNVNGFSMPLTYIDPIKGCLCVDRMLYLHSLCFQSKYKIDSKKCNVISLNFDNVRLRYLLNSGSLRNTFALSSLCDDLNLSCNDLMKLCEYSYLRSSKVHKSVLNDFLESNSVPSDLAEIFHKKMRINKSSDGFNKIYLDACMRLFYKLKDKGASILSISENSLYFTIPCTLNVKELFIECLHYISDIDNIEEVKFSIGESFQDCLDLYKKSLSAGRLITSDSISKNYNIFDDINTFRYYVNEPNDDLNKSTIFN